MNTETEASIQDRYDALRAYWLTIVQASRAIGVTPAEFHSPGVIISGKDEKFGNLRIPIKVDGVVVAEIYSIRESLPGELSFDFSPTCPDWVRTAVTNPDTNPLGY